MSHLTELQRLIDLLDDLGVPRSNIIPEKINEVGVVVSLTTFIFDPSGRFIKTRDGYWEHEDDRTEEQS